MTNPINFVVRASRPPRYAPTIIEIKSTNTVNLIASVHLGQATKANSLLTSDRYLMGFTWVLYQST